MRCGGVIVECAHAHSVADLQTARNTDSSPLLSALSPVGADTTLSLLPEPAWPRAAGAGMMGVKAEVRPPAGKSGAGGLSEYEAGEWLRDSEVP